MKYKNIKLVSLTLPVTIQTRKRLAPSRTKKLSSSWLMILSLTGMKGKVGRCGLCLFTLLFYLCFTLHLLVYLLIYFLFYSLFLHLCFSFMILYFTLCLLLFLFYPYFIIHSCVFVSLFFLSFFVCFLFLVSLFYNSVEFYF